MATSEGNAASAGGDIEETDLQRRVLAHERILQVLIAHLAEAEPGIMPRLKAAFGGRRGSARREYDYIDTPAYAGQFLREVEQLVAEPATHPSRNTTAAQPATEMRLPPGNALVPSHGAIAPLAILRVEYRRLLWEVTRDGKFYGHYYERQPALDAAVAAATAIVAQSGHADVVLEHGSSAAERSAHERGVNVPRSVQTMRFR